MKGKVSLYRIFSKSELNITKHISIFLTQVQGDAAFSALIVNSYLYSHTRMRELRYVIVIVDVHQCSPMFQLTFTFLYF